MEVLLNNTHINVIITKKNNKNIYFRFDDALNLLITTPKKISEKELNRLILKNSKSLEKMLQKARMKALKNSEFWYLGNKYNVIYDESAPDIIFYNGTITCKNPQTLAKFLQSQIKDIFTDEVNKMRAIIKTPNFTLKFRHMKTRWGVCNYVKCTITLNTELIKYKKDLLRYVIIHEMCHFYHHDHSPSFWHMVSLYYPEYKEARKELRNS